MNKTVTHSIKTNAIASALYDFLSVSIGWLVFNVIRFYSLPTGFSSGLYSWLLNRTVIIGQILIPACMLALYAISGCYNSDRGPLRSRLDELLNTCIVSFIGMLGIFFTTLLNDNIPERFANYELMLILLLCLIIPTTLIRMIITTRRMKRMLAGEGLRPALIVGATPNQSDAIKLLIDTAPKIGYEVVAVHNSGLDFGGDTFCGLRLVSGQINELCENLGIKALILPITDTQSIRTPELAALYRLEIPIFIAPDLINLFTLRPRLQAVRPEPLLDIASVNISPTTKNLKRIGDIIGSSLALILFSPLLAAVAIAVKLDSKGPVFYRQERIGYRKRLFKIIKFRTMKVDAEDNGPALSTPGDARVTRLGHWLRKYRIDELPQFWNVLKGEMSIVGPRPERPYFAEKIIERQPAYTIFYKVRPGITSWGMVKFGYASSVDQMVERMAYDMLYIQNVSLPIDLKILLHTVSTVITGRGI